MAFYLSLLSLNIQSFVPLATLKGVLFANLFLLMQIFYDSLFRKKFINNVFISFSVFLFFFLLWQLIVQVGYVFNFSIPDDLVFISRDDGMMMRSSLLTQSFYLFSSVVFFIYLYYVFKNKIISAHKVNKFVKAGLVFYVFYGFYEWFFFLLTGSNGDVFSNRITGDDFNYGLYQNITLAGFNFMRLKSLAGEPSMLAYTLVPFFIYYYYLKDKFWVFILFALLLSTSSTAFLGIFIFLLFDLIFIRKALGFLLAGALIFFVIYIAFYDVINDLIMINKTKMAMEDQSGGERSEFFLNHFNAWLDSNFLHFLLGHGWGYVRSTDLLSTLLYNTGLVGFLFVTLFFFYPAYKVFSRSAEHYALSSVLVAIYIMEMVSVSEPYYFHVWYFLALAYFYVLKGGKDDCCKC